jgi:hypothetical protein
MNISSDHPNKPSDASGATPLSVTLATARKISGLGYTTLWKLIGNETLATVRVGRRRLIAYESLRQLLTPESPNSAAPTGRRGRPRKEKLSYVTQRLNELTGVPSQMRSRSRRDPQSPLSR